MKTIFHFHLIIVSSLLLSVDSCQNKKSTTATSTATTQQQTTTTNTTATVSTTPKDDNVRFVVSFYSKGEGIDNKVNEAFVKFLASYTKKIVYEPTHWGREGEIDYCLKLSELPHAEQVDFIKKAKDLLSKSALVHVNENAKCVHKH